MRDIVDRLEETVPGHVYAETTRDRDNCVLYSFNTVSSDRVTQRVRLKVTIISSTTASGLTVEQDVKRRLLTLGDNPLCGDVLKVTLNGGGVLSDMARGKIHRILYFDIIQRFGEG